jgi:hypothetical protein
VEVVVTLERGIGVTAVTIGAWRGRLYNDPSQMKGQGLEAVISESITVEHMLEASSCSTILKVSY